MLLSLKQKNEVVLIYALDLQSLAELNATNINTVILLALVDLYRAFVL